MALARELETRIAEVLASDDPRFTWLRPLVREHRFLPLYVGWLSTLGLRPDGSFVRWDQEADQPVLRPLTNARWQRLALSQGVKEYPELHALLPERPADAVPCETCGGSGKVASHPHLICSCFGSGWVVPGESDEDNPS